MVLQLPDALDLLTILVDAGLGFDAALAKIGEHLRGPLVEEFELTLNEMRVGETRANALRKLAARSDLPELQAFVQALLYADELGSPLGRVLRVQAAESRRRRQVAAEERAMKAPVKMLVPILLFIFPVMFVVLLGPAVYRIFQVL
jgi:tight adherence protein C